MPNRAVERDVDQLHIRFVEIVYRLRETDQIDAAQFDDLMDLLQNIDQYDLDTFKRKWEAVIGAARREGGTHD